MQIYSSVKLSKSFNVESYTKMKFLSQFFKHGKVAKKNFNLYISHHCIIQYFNLQHRTVMYSIVTYSSGIRFCVNYSNELCSGVNYSSRIWYVENCSNEPCSDGNCSSGPNNPTVTCVAVMIHAVLFSAALEHDVM